MLDSAGRPARVNHRAEGVFAMSKVTDRRSFLEGVAAVAASAAVSPLVGAAPTRSSDAERAVVELFKTLTPDQRRKVAFPWDHRDKDRGLLRTFVSNNWQVTGPHVVSDFYSMKQQGLIHDIFKALVDPQWYPKFIQQLKDDTDGRPWGQEQSIALFGEPDGKFQFVMTGRHMTLRSDGDAEPHVAFGGPIFYGHAASGFTEKAGHPGNVFWPQALAANEVFAALDEGQKKKALVDRRPPESAVGFRKDPNDIPGLHLAEVKGEPLAKVENALAKLLEPFRKEDRDEVRACLAARGGLKACCLTFYKESDLGGDGVWDNWRLEGPAFVWHFRGTPHVHVWVNVADDPTVKLNARG